MPDWLLYTVETLQFCGLAAIALVQLVGSLRGQSRALSRRIDALDEELAELSKRLATSNRRAQAETVNAQRRTDAQVQAEAAEMLANRQNVTRFGRTT